MTESRIIDRDGIATIDYPLPALDMSDLHEIIDAQSRRILQDTNLRGAAMAVLHAVHNAGGYHVFDPQHQEPVQRAMWALENAMKEALT